jgi:hypothetical protein
LLVDLAGLRDLQRAAKRVLIIGFLARGLYSAHSRSHCRGAGLIFNIDSPMFLRERSIHPGIQSKELQAEFVSSRHSLLFVLVSLVCGCAEMHALPSMIELDV